MRTVLNLLAISLLATLPIDTASAQTVYKCKGPDGAQIFSQQPCPDDAEQLQARPMSSHAAANHAFKRTEALAALTVRKDECIRHANARAYNEADLRIRHHNDRIVYIEGRMSTADAVQSDQQAAMRDEIADLQQTIASERAQADASFADEQQRCENQQREAAASLAEVG